MSTNDAYHSYECPVPSQGPGAQGGEDVKCYKLSRKRWSYNEVELVIQESGGYDRQIRVQQVIQSIEAKDEGVHYDMVLSNGFPIKVHAYMCHDLPQPLTTGLLDANGTVHKFKWTKVMRTACNRGCQGPVMRALQRFGKLGKRNKAGDSQSSMKSPSRLYLSLDEACSHVNAKAFRLVAGLYDANTRLMLGSAVSSRIRVVANNDMQKGAAHIRLVAVLPSTWAGWAILTTPNPLPLALPSLLQRQTDPTTTAHHSDISGSPNSSVSPVSVLGAIGSQALAFMHILNGSINTSTATSDDATLWQAAGATHDQQTTQHNNPIISVTQYNSLTPKNIGSQTKSDGGVAPVGHHPEQARVLAIMQRLTSPSETNPCSKDTNNVSEAGMGDDEIGAAAALASMY